jgi:branched-chain amino acid transport system ATP-binding protein
MRDDGGTSIERRNQLAKTMSGGEQQMLAIARALMSEPKILLLDEPSPGPSPLLVKDLFAILRSIITKDRSVVLVEQNVHQSIRLADRVYVLENGRIVRSGSQAEIREDAIVQQAYSGGVRHCHKASGQTAASVAARRTYRNPVEERCGFW